MDNKINLVGFAAIMLLSFGITYLNLEDLSLEENYKAYIQIGLGIILLLTIYIKKRNAN
jgi:hypothetical protein